MSHQETDRNNERARTAGRAALPLDLAPDLTELKAYTQSKQAMAQEIRALQEILRKSGQEPLATRCQELMVKLAEDRFTLAVLGQFKRGKSSLMNAIIGRDLLPTGILPLTSVITILKFGPRERLILHRRGALSALFPEEAPVACLADYVTEQGNPGNRKNLTAAYLEWPLPFLRRGLEFVDTPGVGSSREANTETTYRFLPQCDAVLFVTSVDSPLTTLEIDFLQRIREHVRKIFFVVNKTDLASDSEREEVLRFISSALKQQMGTEKIKVFPLSARLGLAAKEAGDADGYLRSGLRALEEALASFLASEKSATFLIAILDKALRLLAAASTEMRLQKQAQNVSKEVGQKRLAELKQRWDQLREARAALLLEMRRRIVTWAAAMVAEPLGPFLQDETQKLTAALGQTLATARWALARPVAKRSAAAALEQLHEDLVTWTATQVNRLNSDFRQRWQQESQALEGHLGSILQVAAEVFGVKLSEDLSYKDLLEGPADLSLSPPTLGKPRWNPAVPLWQAYGPVLVAGQRLRQRLSDQILKVVGSYEYHVLAAFDQSINEAMDRLALALDARADAFQSRLLQAVMGSQGSTGPPPAVKGEAGLSDPIEALANLEKKLVLLRDQLFQPQRSAAEVDEPPVPIDHTEAPPVTAELPSVPGVDANIARDLRGRGCPVCQHMARAAFDLFAQWQYTLTNDEAVQRAYAAELGLCPLHTWQLEAVASPLGISLGYPKLLECVARELLQLARTGTNPADAVLALVRDVESCRACRGLRDTEAAYVRCLAGFVEGAERRPMYANSQGVCLRHLGLLLAAVFSKEVAEFLLTEAARHFEEIAEDMRSYAVKRDALRRDLYNQDEEDAYLRALVHLVGASQVSIPWKKDLKR